jgi:hypothetical protein
VAAAETPHATKVALVGVLVATALLLAGFLRAVDGGPVEPRAAGVVLAALTAFFALRVSGQLLVRARAPGYLPPMQDWNLVPYRLLLPIQLLFLVVMILICADLLGPGEPVAGRSRPFGRAAVAFSFVYAGAMAIRYAVRMTRRPEQRWFGGSIPIVFHVVLAAFVFVLGVFHAA